MVEFSDGARGSFLTIQSEELPRGLPNLLDYIEQRGPVISLVERGRFVTEEFRQDLEIAAKRADAWLQRSSSSARARELIFTSLDGLTCANRCPEAQVAMIELVESMTAEDRKMRFLPASSKAAGNTAVIGARCACAVSEKGGEAFLSTDLGFLELAVVAQGALLQALVLRGRAMGLAIRRPEAFRKLCSLPDCDFDHPTVGAEFTKTMINADGKALPGFVTVCH